MQPDHDPEFSRALREKVDQHMAPNHLRRNILAGIEQQRRPVSVERVSIWRYLESHWRALSTAAACGAAAMLVGSQLMIASAPDDGLMLQVMASHNRALTANHLIDVVSSDQHTVKPWFAGKVDYSPRVKDFATNGFELAGGRHDYVNDRVVAALVYKRRLHMIDVYSWPTPVANAPVERQTRRGINMVQWIDGGMKYCAVSDIDFGELNELARLMRSRQGE